MPRIKEILGKKFGEFLGKRNLEEMLGEDFNPENVQFKDKNQQKQYLERKEKALVKKGKSLELMEF